MTQNKLKLGIKAEEVNEPTSFLVSPTRNKGKFNIEIKGTMNGTYPVEILFSFGKIITQLTLNPRVPAVDLGRVNKGPYIMKIETNEGFKRVPIYVE